MMIGEVIKKCRVLMKLTQEEPAGDIMVDVSEIMIQNDIDVLFG